MQRMTKKYSQALKILDVEHACSEELYEKMRELNLRWNTDTNTWEYKLKTKAYGDRRPTICVSTRVDIELKKQLDATVKELDTSITEFACDAIKEKLERLSSDDGVNKSLESLESKIDLIIDYLTK